MTDFPRSEPAHVDLPSRFIDRLVPTFNRFLHIEAAGGAVLLVCTVLALILANSPWATPFAGLWDSRLEISLGPFEFGRSLRGWVNDGLMTLFFFLVALELKRELVLGEMRNPRMAALSVAAALGGMLVPATLYLLLQWGQPGQHGWGIVMATDTAFVIACLALLGARIPHSLRVFMLFLAIVDDIGAILVVAVGYSSHLDLRALGAAVLCLVVLRMLAHIGIRSLPIFVAVGCATWVAVDASGLHATVTGVILGLMTPARRWVSDSRLYAILSQVVAHPAVDLGSGDTRDRSTLQLAEIAARESLSPLERLEMALHPWVSFCVMPVFALANAGLVLSREAVVQPLAIAVFVGLALGKPVGILLFSWLALRSGFAIRSPDLLWGRLAGGSLLAGIGFTMALFITNLALSGPLVDSAKVGIFMASVTSAVAGISLLAWHSARRPDGAGRSSLDD
ncbi:Na+/H+ antiporter NhaA [Methyloversatilis thermotolerans]|uniref:Na+/H+ antiporter NhaA n=1 Tax=Methyloversatilis thermotolerans TaxID=1346290 RepID=UPI000365C6BC|nr:Na+/H+ antiporter NhaA [Methyloversatilis thermotolerans]